MQVSKANKIVSAIEGQDHSTDIVPLSERKGLVTLGLLWITMVTGFPTVLVGFEWFKAGITLTQVLLGVFISCIVLLMYSLPACYLGARSGMTYALLSRKVFGRWGSFLVSINLSWVAIAWYGLIAMFLAEGLQGLYNFGIPTVWLATGLAIVMALNNFFGFTGIANFARYIAAPVLIVWVAFTFCKATATASPAVFSMSQHQPFFQSLTLVSSFVIGYAVWGNEADFWRYGKPSKKMVAVPLVISLMVGQILFPITGWLLAYMTGITETAAATNLMNQYAFGGVSLIAMFVLVVTYFAVNDSGLYGAINGLENVIEIPRKVVVAALAIAGAIAAFALTINGHAFELVAITSSIVLPSVTVIMLVEYFVIRLGKEPFSNIPKLGELSNIRLAAIISLLIGYATGFATSGLIPTLDFLHVGICSLQAWIASGLSYLVLRTVELRYEKAQQQKLERIYQNLPAEAVKIDD